MKIVFLDRYSLGAADMGPVSALGDYVEYEFTEPARVVERSADADVIITNKVVISDRIMEALPRLKLICVAATGVNNVDTDYATAKGISVRNAAGYSTRSVAEATLAMALGLLRHTVYYDRYVKDGRYAASGRPFALDRSVGEICGKVWGIIGMGTIGRRVAELAMAFGAQVSYYSTSGRNNDAGYLSLPLGDLLAGSDIVSIHAPLNDATEGLLNYSNMKLMRPSSILINVGRGGIVDEAGLARCLNEGVIAGAGLDVFASEPLEAGSPLLTLADGDRLLAAPHCAWSSDAARRTLVEMIADNIKQELGAG